MMKTILDSVTGLANLPDLIILGVVLFCALAGAKRGLVRTVMNCAGRFAALALSVTAARVLAPAVGQYLVAPIVGEVFEKQAASLLDGLPPSVVQAIGGTATTAAARMAESLAYTLLVGILLILFNFALHMISDAMRLLTHIGPIGALNRLAGLAVGAAFGLALCLGLLWALRTFSPATFTALGWLSPETVASTTLTQKLLGLLPAAV